MNRKIGKCSCQNLPFADDSDLPTPTNSKSLILPDDDAGPCHQPHTSNAELLSNDDVEFMDIGYEEMMSTDDENGDSEAYDEDDEASEVNSIVYGEAQASYVLVALREWVVDYNISQRALRALIQILKIAYNDKKLPKDPRTIMKTPRSVEVTKMSDGSEYWHQGLEICLRNCFKDFSADKTISINLNIDGLPLFNSATKCFWPILFNIFEHPEISPMSIGIFYGERKPENAAIYFRPFVDEFKGILENGLIINGKQLTVVVRCFICDSPARAFVKGK